MSRVSTAEPKNGVDLFSLPNVTVGKLALAQGWRECGARSLRTGNHNNAELSTQVNQKLAKTAIRQVFARTLPTARATLYG